MKGLVTKLLCVANRYKRFVKRRALARVIGYAQSLTYALPFG